MVEIPVFWIAYGYSGTTHRWKTANEALPGFERHPAFYKDGAWVANRYIGAYEGSMYDASESAMCVDASVVSNIYAAGDKLCSVSGYRPKTNETRAEFRAMAASRGASWRQQDFYLTSALQLLYLVEYANFNSQSMIGNGLTGYATSPNEPQANAGNSNSIGNAAGGSFQAVPKWAASTAKTVGAEVIPLAVQTGYTYICTVAGTTGGAEPAWPTTLTDTIVDGGITWECTRTLQYMSYRGIENFYGHLYKYIDGINVNGYIPYVCNTASQFADDTTTNYVQLKDTGGSGITLGNAEGYIVTLEQTKGGFLPASVWGSPSTYVTDYYVPNSGWCLPIIGGSVYNGVASGPFFIGLVSTQACSVFNGRLAY